MIGRKTCAKCKITKRRRKPQKQDRSIPGTADWSRLYGKPEDAPTLPFDSGAKR